MCRVTAAIGDNDPAGDSRDGSKGISGKPDGILWKAYCRNSEEVAF
jgi:hypothetical protein